MGRLSPQKPRAVTKGLDVCRELRVRVVQNGIDTGCLYTILHLCVCSVACREHTRTRLLHNAVWVQAAGKRPLAFPCGYSEW